MSFNVRESEILPYDHIENTFWVTTRCEKFFFVFIYRRGEICQFVTMMSKETDKA